MNSYLISVMQNVIDDVKAKQKQDDKIYSEQAKAYQIRQEERKEFIGMLEQKISEDEKGVI